MISTCSAHSLYLISESTSCCVILVHVPQEPSACALHAILGSFLMDQVFSMFTKSIYNDLEKKIKGFLEVWLIIVVEIMLRLFGLLALPSRNLL